MKRLKASIGSSGYGQVAFSYDQPTNQSEEPDAGKNDDKDDPADEPYVPHRKFYIPPNMELVRKDFYSFTRRDKLIIQPKSQFPAGNVKSSRNY